MPRRAPSVREVHAAGPGARRLGLALLAALGTSRIVPAQTHRPSAPATPPHARATAHATLGAVHFATSCAPAVRTDFDRGVALLHSFEFGTAIATFSRVLETDSTCAMAQWGIAMSRWTNPMAPGTRSAAALAPGTAATQHARDLASHATPRERAYIDAVALLYDRADQRDQAMRVADYERAMAALARRFPADTEAAIFHAVSLIASAPPTDKTYARQLQAARALEAIWARQPDHPGITHYLIHAYDVPALAGRARRAAERYAGLAPDAAHALHMPSHTFTRVGMWEPSIETNLRSANAARASGATAELLHAYDYAAYAYLQRRQFGPAKALVDSLPAIAARFDPNAVTGAAPGSAGVFALAAIPARYALERREWQEAAALVPAPSAFPWTEAMTYFARALGAAHRHALDDARAAIDSLDAIHRRLTSAEPYWAEQVAIQSLGGQAWLALAEGRNDDAERLMREAADREDATEKAAVTPGPLAPARELLGDLLLELQEPREALVAYRTALRHEPQRFHATRGARRAAAMIGTKTKQAF